MYWEKHGISRFFANHTLQTFLYKSASAFLIETSISKNMGDLNGVRRCI